MSYVVYHTKSTREIKRFATESGAKRSTTCMNRKAVQLSVKHQNPVIDVYAYTDETNYNANIVYMKKVKNLISGNEIEIPSDTPHACDPSSETYWSA